MILFRTLWLLLLVLTIALVTSPGIAKANHTGSDKQEASNYDPRPYLVLSGIRGQINNEDEGSLDIGDQSQTGFELTLGEKFSRHFALEFGFANLGSYRITDSQFPASDSTRRVRLTSLEVNLLSYLFLSGNALSPVSKPGVALYVKTGLSRCTNNYDDTNDQLCDSYYLNLGLGMDLHLSRNVAIRFEAQSLLNDFYAARAGFVFRGEFVDALLQFFSILIYFGNAGHH